MTEYYQMRKRMLRIMWAIIFCVVAFELVLFLQVKEIRANTNQHIETDVVTNAQIQKAVSDNAVRLDSIRAILNRVK
jgi:CHASE3 domain sensor protein